MSCEKSSNNKFFNLLLEWQMEEYLLITDQITKLIDT